jgi:hypothetical protein
MTVMVAIVVATVVMDVGRADAALMQRALAESHINASP